MKEALGRNHMSVGVAVNVLAMVFAGQGRLEEGKWSAALLR